MSAGCVIDRAGVKEGQIVVFVKDQGMIGIEEESLSCECVSTGNTEDLKHTRD